MSTVSTHVHAPRPSLFAGLRSFLNGCIEGYAMRNDYLRTVSELERLSDRELEDIGIARAEIPAIAARRAVDLHV